MPATRHQPIFAAADTAAQLFDMKTGEFLALVEKGVLPKPHRIGGHERWFTDELRSIVSGRTDTYEDVQW